jgi:predicted NAD/FAD-binding protein
MGPTDPLHIAVVGAGVAGITAAYLLQRRHRVCLLERNDWIGGHTRTVTVPDGPDAGLPVDVGFIVLNDRTYPLLNRLLDQLGVATADSDMSFGYHCRETGLQYATRDFRAVFAQRSNLLRPPFLAMLAEILRFNRTLRRALHRGELADTTLGGFLDRHRFGGFFRRAYIVPMAAAIWSAPDRDVARFPAETFGRFFRNHGLLRVRNQPRWRYIPGGSHTYVKAFLEGFRGEVRSGAPVVSVRRTPEGVRVRMADGADRAFDRVVIACHADEALALLEDPSPQEREYLGAWRYARNRVVLHTDASRLPPIRRAWASWNVVREPGAGDDAPVTLTYHMNRLQGLRARHPYCVTLNPSKPVADRHTVFETPFDHPCYTFASIGSQRRLPELNGRRGTFFCGSYFGYGFHEDAVRSGVRVAEAFGISL